LVMYPMIFYGAYPLIPKDKPPLVNDAG